MYIWLWDLKIRKSPQIFQLNPVSAHEHFNAKWEAEESDVVEEEDTVVALQDDVREMQASEIGYAAPGSEVTLCRDGKGLELRERGSGTLVLQQQ